MNVVMTGDGRLVEVQATAEREPFSRELLDELLDLAAGGIDELERAQRSACEAPSPWRGRRRAHACRLVLASGNPNKLARAAARAPRLGDRAARRAATSPPEDGATFVDNARIKARHGRAPRAAGRLGRSGRTRGSRSPALGGAPGRRSPRAGRPTAVARLLAELEGGDERRARYVCELVALAPGRARGRRRGHARGDDRPHRAGSEGFGYDPIFVPDGESRTVAELGDEWKRAHSHRARAAAALARQLRAI